MAAGKITLEANDGKRLSLVAPEGMGADSTGTVVTTNSPTFTGTPTINGTPVSLFGNGFKNYIIDGRFDFWYEGTSQISTGYGSDTMWYNGNGGSTKTHTRQSFAVGGTFPDGKLMPMYFSRTEASSVEGAGNHVNKNTKLEDVTRLAGKTVTLSFYAKADSNKNIAIVLEQYFGSGGTPSSSVTSIGTQKIALTAEWVKYSRTFTIPSIAGKTLGTDGVHTSFSLMRFWFDAGSDFSARTDSLGQQSGTFDIAMVQLEEGSAATDFEWNGTAVEKHRINRYFLEYKGSGTICSAFARSDTVAVGDIVFPSPMRVPPAVSSNATTDNEYCHAEIGGVDWNYLAVAKSGGANGSNSAISITAENGAATMTAGGGGNLTFVNSGAYIRLDARQ